MKKILIPALLFIGFTVGSDNFCISQSCLAGVSSAVGCLAVPVLTCTKVCKLSTASLLGVLLGTGTYLCGYYQTPQGKLGYAQKLFNSMQESSLCRIDMATADDITLQVESLYFTDYPVASAYMEVQKMRVVAYNISDLLESIASETDAYDGEVASLALQITHWLGQYDILSRLLRTVPDFMVQLREYKEEKRHQEILSAIRNSKMHTIAKN